MEKYYALLADIIVTFHFLYVTFTVGGEFLIIIGAIFKWVWIRNRAFRITHLVAVVLVSIEAVIGMFCPLTEWENNLRIAAGQSIEKELSFIARLLRMIIFYDFPEWFFTMLYIGWGVIVILTLVFIPPNKKSAAIAAQVKMNSEE